MSFRVGFCKKQRFFPCCEIEKIPILIFSFWANREKQQFTFQKTNDIIKKVRYHRTGGAKTAEMLQQTGSDGI